MKLGEIVVHMGNYNFTKFHQNQMKNKKVLIIARFSVQNFKVSVESWKLYIVRVKNITVSTGRHLDLTSSQAKLDELDHCFLNLSKTHLQQK